jgi:hypothetical protein
MLALVSCVVAGEFLPTIGVSGSSLCVERSRVGIEVPPCITCAFLWRRDVSPSVEVPWLCEDPRKPLRNGHRAKNKKAESDRCRTHGRS